MAERKYVIIGTDEVENIEWDKVLHDSPKYLRINNEGTKCIINYEGNQPSFLIGKQEYTKQEMYTLTSSDTNEWYIPSSDLENDVWYNKVKDIVVRYNPFKNWF